MKHSTFIGTIACIVLLTACYPRGYPPIPTPDHPVPCSEILESKLASKGFVGLSGQKANRWIRENYPNADLKDVGQGPGYVWKVGERYYSALENEPAGGLKVAYYHPRPVPSVEDVIACLGTPESYYVGKTDNAAGSLTTFEMWYPAKGIYLSNVGIDLVASRSQPAKARLYDVAITAASTITDMVLIQRGGDLATDVLKNTKPWPADIKDIDFGFK